jgi:hypothetical protein
MNTRTHRGLVYTELSRAGTNVTLRAYAPAWWTYTTTLVIPAEVWDACPAV